MEESEAFKDVEFTFSDAHYNSETKSLDEDKQEDQASEEIQLHKSGKRSS